LVTVELKQLRSEKSSAQEFLRERINSEIKISGTRIEFPSEKTKDLKLLLHKFLHEKNLTNFRVLSGRGVLEIAPTAVRREVDDDDKVRGVPPFPPLSDERLPLGGVLYPNYGPSSIRWIQKPKKDRR
jgi:hypothetical protein